MFDGYLELGGNEIVNSSRVAKYVQKNAPHIALKDCEDCDSVAEATGDGVYESPKDDQAPWFDPTNPATANFLGVYSLGIEGVDDSTWTASVTESLGNGGTVGGGRHTTRTMRVHGVMVAENDLGMQAGMTWLKAALQPGDCADASSPSCLGANMCYFNTCPDLCRQWEDDYTAGSGFPYSVTDGGQYILRYPSPGPIYKGAFGGDITTQLDGNIVRWGAVDAFETSREVESYGPVVMRRTNLLPDPSFTYGGLTAGWDVDGGFVMPTGGVDGGAFVRAQSYANDRNVVADPSLEHYEPAELGWTSKYRGVGIEVNHDFDAQPIRVEDVTAADGTHLVRIQPDATGFDDSGGVTVFGSVTIPLTALNPFDDTSDNPHTAGASFRCAEDVSIWITLFDENGNIVGNSWEDFLIGGSGWYYSADYETYFTHQEGWSLQIAWGTYETTPITAPMELDTIAFLDTGNTDFAGWFSGDTVSTDPDIGFRYADGTPLSASQRFYLSNDSYVTTPEFKPFFGDNIVTFWVRGSSDGQLVKMSAYDDEDVRGEATFAVSTEWRRYSFSTRMVGLPTWVDIYGEGEFDLDQAMVEAGAIEMPFLSCDTPWEAAAEGFIVGGWEAGDEYTVTCTTGDPATSTAVMEWNGIMRVGGQWGAKTDLEFWQAKDGQCDSWMFIQSIQGDQTGFGGYSIRFEVPLERKLLPYERTMHDVTCTTGVRVIRELPVSNGKMREIEFFLTAGVPFAYSTPETLFENMPFSLLPSHPWGADQCAPVTVAPIVDPDCVVPPAPPRPPQIPNSCVLTESLWRRSWLPIPADMVSAWSEVAPQIAITSGDTAIREVRARVFRNPFDREVEPWGRENLIQNPRAIGAGTAWLGTAGTTGVAPITYLTGQNFFGVAGIPEDITTAARMKWSTASTAGTEALGARSAVGSVTPGQEYFSSIWGGYRYAAGSGTASMSGSTQFYDAVGTALGSAVTTSNVDVPHGSMAKFEMRAVAPENASYAVTRVRYMTGNAAINDELWAVGALVQRVPQDSDVHTLDSGGFNQPYYAIDFGDLPPTWEAQNVVIDGGTEMNPTRVLRLNYGGGGTPTNSNIYFEVGGLVPGEAYALNLYPWGGSASTELKAWWSDSTGFGPIQPPVRKGPFSPFEGTGNLMMGVAIATGEGVAGFYIDVKSSIAETMVITGLSVWRVAYSEDYFDGSTPAGGGSYYQWTAAKDASSSFAADGINVDPCDWCSEFILSYIPAKTTLTVDAILERAFASVAGGPEQAADTLLYGSDGGPMSWPSLTCGIPYLLAIDVPEDYVDEVRISVELTRRES